MGAGADVQPERTAAAPVMIRIKTIVFMFG
jgi:hypothetical protein